MASDRDYYEILGVPRTADEAALKAAFRKLAKQHHPDANPGDPTAEAKFKEAAEAYEVLSDAQKRAAYDRYGKAAFQGGAGPGGGAGFGDFSDLFNEVFGEAFGDLFGRGGRARQGPDRGADLRYDIEITLEDAFAGVERQLTVPTRARCEPCGGSGAGPGSSPEPCTTCQGSGQVRATQGMFRVVRTCHVCGGRGSVIKNPCQGCRGQGQVQKDKTLSVKIPAGIEDGMRIRLSGEGDAGARGGQPGDLYLFVSVRQHSLFDRDGADLFCRAPVPMTTAALGGDIDIPTLDGGRSKISLPAGAQTGRRFRLKGQGLPNMRGPARGDLHVEIMVETPTNLTAKQRKLLEEFAASCGAESHPQSTGFFDSVKRFFDGGDQPHR